MARNAALARQLLGQVGLNMRALNNAPAVRLPLTTRPLLERKFCNLSNADVSNCISYDFHRTHHLGILVAPFYFVLLVNLTKVFQAYLITRPALLGPLI